MQKILTFVGIVGLVFVVATFTYAQENISVGPREEAPKIDPDVSKPTPAVRPTDGRQVAVLNIQFQVEGGKILEAGLVDAKRINSIAPKVFNRKSGDWQVLINGSRRNSFYVFNPIYLEADGKEGAENPYTWVPQDGTVDWSLVVPLYRGTSTLNVASITIIDRQSGEVIMEARL